MTQSTYIIVGAGGHGTVLADTLLSLGACVLGFTDSNPTLHGATVCGLPVLGGDDALTTYDPQAIWLVNGVGSLDSRKPSSRSRLQQVLTSSGWRFGSVIHPAACVSRFAKLGAGVQVMAGCIVQAGANIGEGVILNTHSVIEHDTIIGAWCHVAPGATVCGQVHIGDFCHIGAGSVIRQGVQLGHQSLIASGAAVVSNCQGNIVLAGVPARPLE